MRVATSSALLALSLGHAFASPLESTECLRLHSDELAQSAQCGRPAEVASCLAALADSSAHPDIEACFVAAGCEQHDAAAEATWALEGCEVAKMTGELRRRQLKPSTAEPDDAQETEAPAQQNPPPATQARQTTAPPPNTPAPEPTKEADVAVVTRTRTNPPANPVVTRQAQTSTPLICTSVTAITTTTCTLDAQRFQTCGPAVITRTVCVDGLLCRFEEDTVTCMVLNNTLTTGGIIVAVVFATAIVVSFGLMIFFCCRDKSREKKLKARLEAAAIAKASASSSATKRQQPERNPLMAQAGVHESPAGSTYGGPTAGGADPFQDQHRAPH